MALPAHLRARFENDPAQLIDFLGDENNRSEAEKLGLLEVPKAESTVTPLDVTVLGDTIPPKSA